MTENQQSIADLARQVRDVFIRIEGLAKRLEDSFVPNKVLELYRENVNLALKALEKQIEKVDSSTQDLDKSKAETTQLSTLEVRIASLEDDKKWLTRLVLGAIALAILGVVVAGTGFPN